MEYFPIIILIFFVLFILTRSLSVILHELGHAIAVILLTKEKAVIYIGSYGDPNKSFKLNIGLIEMWFRRNPIFWQWGLCAHTVRNVSVNKKIIYTLAGSLTSFFIAATACYFTFAFDLHSSLKLVFIVFVFSATLDLKNLIPNKRATKLYNGTLVHNDGYKLKALFQHKKIAKLYTVAASYYDEKDYEKAAKLFDNLIEKNGGQEDVCKLAFTSYLLIKNYQRAKEIIEKYSDTINMNDDDFSNAGLAYLQLGFHTKALEFYDKSLALNPINKYTLNNKGFTLNRLERYEEALPVLDKAIEADTDFAYSYNNRGLAKIKLGKTEEGLNDINKSFELDIDNAYAHRNLGVYYLEKGNYKEALKSFITAKEIDKSTYEINELILQTEQFLNQ